MLAFLKQSTGLRHSPEDVILALIRGQRNSVLVECVCHLDHVFFAVIGDSDSLCHTRVNTFGKPLGSLFDATGMNMAMYKVAFYPALAVIVYPD